ncbi:hypothetical protein [Brevundimonas aveniformis]|uniref:hypothetical protein n=1 Tax=Brevundimonas aveniformis TaxID=370977 RepID=UPI000491F322|nr:hypothetical protein [Brevundimonas aveniformis]
MTEQPPVAPGATPEPVEPKSLPDNLAQVSGTLRPPNEIEARSQGRTAAIVLLALVGVIVAGLVAMALTWQQALPSSVTDPGWQVPSLGLPWESDQTVDDASGKAPSRDPELTPLSDGTGNPTGYGSSDKPAT